MLANCDKMVSITPPTTNQWPQNNEIIDDSNSNKIIMEKQGGGVQEQPALKCPRCDSSNTKFCYYNNYSLSQPRHFCKACKRYWTRGGTLRNVPVGGGYKRNNKLKRPISTIDSTTTNSNSNSTSNHVNPMFNYGLSTTTSSNSISNHCGVNLNFSRLSSTNSGYYNHVQTQMNNNPNIGLRFSSGFDDNDYNNPLVSRYDDSIFSSTLLQHKFMNDGLKYGQENGSSNNKNSSLQGLEFASLDQNQMQRGIIGNGNEKGIMMMKKVDQGQNQIMGQMGGFYDPSSSLCYWNDQGSNIGSSLTSLI